VLIKHRGDVHRDLARSEPTTFVTVLLPDDDIDRVRSEGKPITLAHLDPGDVRAAPFHRLIDAACGSADRLALEVALAEAIDAVVTLRGAQPEHARPIRRAVDYIRSRMCESFTLDDLAAYAGLDKFHLCRSFRARIGMPQHTYLTHLRVARAKQLLLAGMRASEVAPLVGFYDQPQLTRHFRRLVGIPPARYAAKST
ncbi:MAG TPA: AraC family transcriptional regulator, partial [Polyangiaceae bacterium]|nr:AraC family transcriptional regulator [Polyangiaceae bacterium]